MASALPPPTGLQKGEDFTKWIKSVEIYMGAINVSTVEQKRNIVLHLLGPEVQDIVDTLPDAEGDGDDYQKLVKKLEKHFTPQSNPVVERHAFNMMEYEGGRVEEYVAKLKAQARKCGFEEAEKQQLIRDKLVVSCPSSKVKEQMLKEENLTLTRAIQIWSTDSTVKEQARRMGKSHEEVNKLTWEMRGRTPWRTEERRNEDKDKKAWRKTSGQEKTWRDKQGDEKGKMEGNVARHCFRCGKMNHMVRVCKVPKHVKCHNSGKAGHLRAACRDPNLKPKAMAVDMEQEEREYEMEEEDYCVYHAMTKPSKAMKVNLLVNDRNVDFVLDTGCPVTIIPEGLIPGLKLRNEKCRLTSYTGHDIPVQGISKVKVKYQGNETKEMDVHVVTSEGPPLLGRSWLKEIRLDWKELVGSIRGDKSLNLKEVLKRNEELFDEALGEMKNVEAHLELNSEAKPVFQPARPVPYGLAEAVQQELKRLEQAGAVREVISDEPQPRWATPLVIVPKPDGSVRPCGDFKVLNANLCAPKYPIPKMEDIFATIGPVEYISVIDLSQAYLQMKLDGESQKLCALNTPFGMYRMLRLPYGVTSSPMLFQREMDRLLKKVPGVKCLLDDVLITGRTEEEALRRLEEVMQIMKSQGLRLKKDKCQFMTKEVRYLGLRLGANGIKPDPQRVKPVLDAEPPKNVKEMREFLGAVTFYSRFIKNLSKMARPLNELLKKNQEWQWTEDCERSFNSIKACLASADVLRHFNAKELVTVITDASPEGLGAVLVQGKEEKPVIYVSRSLSEHEKKYSQIEREGLCVVWACQRLRQYLYGQHFKLITDNKPLAQVLGPNAQLPTLAVSRIQRWAMKLAEYDFSVEVRRSEQIPVADWLSRLPREDSVLKSKAPEDECTVCLIGQLESLNPVTAAAIQRETARSPILSKVMHFVNQGWPEVVSEELQAFKARQTELTVERGCLMWGCRVIVPPNLRAKVLSELHSGHQGMVKMKQLSRMYVWWPNMDKQIEMEVRRCEGCWQKRAEPPSGELHPWEYAKGPWQRIHLDFAGPVAGHYYVVIIDSYSKWIEIAPMKSITSEKTIDYLLNVFARWGLPHQIVTDNGPQLVSKEFEDFLQRNGIKHIVTAPYKPSTNGAAERAVGSLKNLLKASRGRKVNLPNFLMAYRSTPQSSTSRSPAELMLGRPLRNRMDLLKPDFYHEVRSKQQEQVEHSQTAHSRNRSLEVGETVLVRDYRGAQRWREGEVNDRLGSKHYLIQVQEQVWRRHIDQVVRLPGVDNRLTQPMPAQTMTSTDIKDYPAIIESPKQNDSDRLSDEQQTSPTGSPDEEIPASPAETDSGASASPRATAASPRVTATPRGVPEMSGVLERRAPSTRVRRPVVRLNL